MSNGVGCCLTWAHSAVCSSGQSDLRRTSAGEGVFGEKRILVEGVKCSVMWGRPVG